MANKEKSLVEEALLQMKNLEEAVTENAKGILASTMKEEISELVKESLSLREQDEEEVDVEMSEMDEQSMEDETEDEVEMDDMEIDMDSDEESDMEDEMGMDLPDEFEVDDEEEVLLPLDLTGASDEEILKVFKAMGEDDGIIVTKDDENIHLKDENDGVEYQIQMEGEEEMDMEDDEEEMDMEEAMDEVVYEIEMEDDEDEEEEEVEDEESMNESSMMAKPVGMGFGKPGTGFAKSEVNKKGFNEKMKQGNATMGMNLKPKKFEFTEEENEEMIEGDYGMGKDEKSKTHKGDKDYTTKKGMTKKTPAFEEEGETMEAARTLGNGSRNDPKRKGLPKMKVQTTNESELKSEINSLRSKNDEYRKALNIFRDKLNEVAVFNSNLAYTVRLFTEHSTTKQEKINILKRFDSVENIKESKSLYKTIREEMAGKETGALTESVESKVQKSPAKGSATNLIESKTYENPQFMRMKDLMSKINK